MGFNENNYYQIFNGHGVMNHIAKPIVLFYAKKYRTQQLRHIAKSTGDKDRKQQLINQYYKQTFTERTATSLSNRVEQLISDNNPDMFCAASIKINEQIDRALK